jgi:hypothetical protein
MRFAERGDYDAKAGLPNRRDDCYL